jgi:site-specific DNA-cytosine methylase
MNKLENMIRHLAAPGNHRGGQFGAIKLGERARAILQGFPETWVFCGATKDSRNRQIGMAMPPPLAAAIVRWWGRA